MTATRLHERYPLQRIRVLRGGRVSTICLEWDLYLKLLTMTPGQSGLALSRIFRDEVKRLEAAGVTKGFSAAARSAVLERLRKEQTLRH